MADTVHILGAGLSGMVAAINIARQGRKVLVLDAAKKIGGMSGFHPSIHTTPVDPVWMSKQIEIDLTGYFHPLKDFLVGIKQKTFQGLPGPLHSVERGHRKTALDTLLYKLALEAGVEFQFDAYLTSPGILPKGSIIATGLHPEMYDYFHLPKETVKGFAAAGKTSKNNWCIGQLDDYSNDYFYANSANNLMYALLFGRDNVSEEALAHCQVQIKEKFNLDLSPWNYFSGNVPTGSAGNPRLFHDGYILAGTLSGAMDPVSLFGIHGALLSGKVAATAVLNRKEGIKTFKRLNRFYSIGYLLRRILERIPGRLIIMEATCRYPLMFFPVTCISSLSIPGYTSDLWNYQCMKQIKRIC